MINTLKYKIYNIFTAKTLHFWLLFVAIFLLSGCINEQEAQLTKDDNVREQISCWQTDVIHAVTEALDKLYGASVGKVAGGGANLVMIGFAVWMAFKLLKVLASFKEENLGEVWTEIIQKGVLCGVCAYLVSSSDHISYAINTFVLPIYQTIVELGLSTVKGVANGSENLGAEFGTINYASLVETCPTGISGGLDSLTKGITNVSDCLVCLINSRLGTGVQIAINLIVSGRLGAIVVGLLFLLPAFVAAKIFFVFFLVDSLFRLNFAVYLLPVLIMGIPFNYTRKWSKHGLLMFLNSSGIMLFTGLLISASVGALETVTRNKDYGYADFEGFGIAMLIILLLAIILFKIPALGVALADKFVGGGGGLEFQKKVQRFVSNTYQKAKSFVIGGLTSGASAVITKQMEKHETTREILSNMREKKNSLSQSIQSLGGHGNDD